MKPEWDFCFEEWASLAKADPEAFELRRKAVIEGFLDASGHRRKLGERLQREIDDVRARSESPLAALVAMTAMLSDQLEFLGEQLAVLSEKVGAIGEAEARACTRG